MKAHTQNFKDEICLVGRQINGKVLHYKEYLLLTEGNDVIVSEDSNNLTTEQINISDYDDVGEEFIYQINIIKNGQLFKSLMKQLNLECKIEFKIGDTVNPKLGLLVNQNYEYLDFKNYIVYSKSYNFENETWNYVCYDKMLYSMIPYKKLNVVYPITVRNYLKAIADKMGVGFANENDQFVNYDILINDDYFNKKNIIYRDVLDKLSEITASNILINDDDELEVRYSEYQKNTKTGTNLSIDDALQKKIYELKGSKESTQDGTPTPDNPVPVNVVEGYRNVLDFVNVNYTTVNYATANRTNGEYVVLNGTSEWGGVVFRQSSINLKPNTVYTFMAKITNTDSTIGARIGIAASMNATGSIIWGKGITTSGISKATFTTPGEISSNAYISLSPRGENKTATYTDILLIEGSQELPYVPYGSNYVLYKQVGKNLFDKDNANILNNRYLGSKISGQAGTKTLYISCKPNTTYTVSKIISARFVVGTTNNIPDLNETVYNRVRDYSASKITITTDSLSEYLLVFYYYSTYDILTEQEILDSIMIEEGTTATTYESYKESNVLIPLNNNIIVGKGDYKDELLVDKNGNVFINKKINKVVLDGSEGFRLRTNDGTNYCYSVANLITNYLYSGNITGFSNYFSNISSVEGYSRALNKGIGLYFYYSSGGTDKILYLVTNTSTTANDLQTWLSTHNTELYYPLATPELIDLQTTVDINLFKGVNNITTSEGLDLSLKYYVVDTIDESYLKDVNVNFSEKFGPINKIDLIDSENKIEYVARSNLTLEDTQLTTINFVDNPLMLNGDPTTICENILNKVKGLEYYLNDFSSSGICYYDYLDIYNVRIKGNDYQCLLLNDEINITQGIQEDIFTELNEDYKSENDIYGSQTLSDKQIKNKLINLDEKKVENKTIINSINQSEESVVINYNKFLKYQTVSGTTDLDGLLDTGLGDTCVIVTTKSSIYGYGFAVPYFDYNLKKWYIKIQDKSGNALINTNAYVDIYYFMKGGNN